jgi:hypothetical protein
MQHGRPVAAEIDRRSLSRNRRRNLRSLTTHCDAEQCEPCAYRCSNAFHVGPNAPHTASDSSLSVRPHA